MATITKSIGTATRDYSTVQAWEDDLGGAAGGSGNDAFGEGYNDSSFSENPLLNDTTPDNVTLTVASGEEHDGTAGTGCLLAGNLLAEGLGDVWEKWECTGASTAVGAYLVVNRNTAALVMTVKRLLCYGSTGARNFGGSAGFSTTVGRAEYLDCIMYDTEQTQSGSVTFHGIDFSAQIHKVLNCTLHDIRNDSTSGDLIVIPGDDSDHTLKNLIVTDPGGTSSGAKDCYDSNFTLSTVDSLQSSDTTANGSNALTSKSATDEYVSITGGFENLHIKNTSSAAFESGVDLGTTPTDVNIDIDGFNRDAGATTWSRGAHDGDNLRGASLGKPLTGLLSGRLGGRMG